MSKKNFKLVVLQIFLVLLMFFSKNISAQLVINNSFTPTQLVAKLLGGGIVATNISYTGAPIAIGFFKGNTNLGLDSGVIITCGADTNAIGPNDLSWASTDNFLFGDKDLDSVAKPTLTFDASILEFDFVPTSDTVKFRYVFGSEEYMEFVDTTTGSAGINDAFGFFISGPGISGIFTNNAENIALIPGTSLPITMKNLNLFKNSVYYFDNGDGGGTGTAPDGLTVQYDGFTTVLTAKKQVECGKQYHIKLVIGDGADRILDSGVFLEAGSFDGGVVGNVTLNIDTITTDSICPYESVLQVTATGIFGTSPIFTWDFGDATVLSGSGSGPYTFIWSSYGIKKIKVGVAGSLLTSPCATKKDSAEIVVENCQPNKINVITPNSDGINDHLIIRHLGSFPLSGIEIYNRWGNNIYKTDDYKNNWPTGQSEPFAGTYYYILSISDGRRIPGYFTLLR